MSGYTILVVVHVLLFAYWLGADWGVFVNSRYVADPLLSLEERRRFLEASFRIDLAPRMAFTLLLPVGLQLAAFYGAWPLFGPFMAGVWAAALSWFAVNLLGYLRQGTVLGDRLRSIDQSIRWILAPLLIALGLWSLATHAPIAATFVALKIVVFGCMILVGLTLRAIMRNWAIGFRRLATEGPTPAVNEVFERSLAKARYVAFGMWSLSGLMAVLGVAKPA